MAESNEKSGQSPSERSTSVIKEGGYQPTIDPGPVPTSLVRPATQTPSDNAPQRQDEK